MLSFNCPNISVREVLVAFYLKESEAQRHIKSVAQSHTAPEWLGSESIICLISMTVPFSCHFKCLPMPAFVHQPSEEDALIPFYR